MLRDGRGMSIILIGALTGLLLSGTSSFLITGRLFHAYQARTPGTWRPESWRQHALAMLMQAIAGAGLAWLFGIAGTPSFGSALFELIAVVWIVIACCVLIQAIYVNWHRGFVVGQLLDWAVFVTGIMLACAWWARGS
jgi:ABC-type branched-subunit amino acid transport system permease subunit